MKIYKLAHERDNNLFYEDFYSWEDEYYYSTKAKAQQAFERLRREKWGNEGCWKCVEVEIDTDQKVNEDNTLWQTRRHECRNYDNYDD